MKVKDYAVWLDETVKGYGTTWGCDSVTEEINRYLSEKFNTETKDLMKLRHVTTKSGLLNVMREMDNKWQILSRKYPFLKKDFYMSEVQKCDFAKPLVKEPEKKTVIHDTMCDIKELMNENKVKFHQLLGKNG